MLVWVDWSSPSSSRCRRRWSCVGAGAERRNRCGPSLRCWLRPLANPSRLGKRAAETGYQQATSLKACASVLDDFRQPALGECLAPQPLMTLALQLESLFPVTSCIPQYFAWKTCFLLWCVLPGTRGALRLLNLVSFLVACSLMPTAAGNWIPNGTCWTKHLRA